jgi:hypothetical protein
MSEQFGRMLVILGGVLLVSGLLFILFSRMGYLNDLPGTINLEVGNGRLSIPILPSIILSILLTIVVNLVLQIFNR